MGNRTVGVLALQGAYQKHIDLLLASGVSASTIRLPHELEKCTALIIPGGESTTISLLIQENGLYEPIKTFAQNHPVMGVCAGMIMMATDVDDKRIKPLGLIPFRALRNHYGRQLHSFTTDIMLDFDAASQNDSPPFPAVFIRAPGVEKLSSDVRILATYNKEAVMIRKGYHMALSFHPELTDDRRIHEYWLSLA